MDLTSVRGTKLSDIVVDHRPSTGRGKKITLAQEAVLRRLYEEELPSVSNGKVQGKTFWANLASRFHEQTGREYSWLSVKRRAAGWRQNSPEVDRRLDTSHGSELGVEDSVAEPSHQDIARESPRQQGSGDSEQTALAQKKPSLHPEDSTTLGLSQLERSPSVGNWLPRNLLSGVTDPSQDSNSNIKSPRVSQRRPRSRSPQRVSQPRYRRRSPSTRRTKIISNRLHHQLASSSDEIVTSGPNPSSGCSRAHEDMQPGHLDKRNPPGFSRVHESVENDERENNPHDSARFKHGESKVSKGLLASPHLSEQDDLPLGPTRIMRRRVAR
ncbi:hypothetical protein N7517_005041 [Penicillium concentricum]|uniref:Uncharacterized protein n=1 Tax=Penicillium concentricum TaxID=293559 RepID=A0A9W9S7Y2_9EURO|nr:uncharacterized protein N7517_005041 [Penicillium concentricum]KAJ5373035.1 hypothetical protein N7517_005041 [Penicillium concentricum]